MKTFLRGGGHLGAWTLNKVNIYLDKVTTDCSVEQVWLKGQDRKYVYRDAFVGVESWGRTPAEAVRKAGKYLPANSCGY